jgi:hypothetical protein
VLHVKSRRQWLGDLNRDYICLDINSSICHTKPPYGLGFSRVRRHVAKVEGCIGQLEQAIEEFGWPLLVGSSLGGYYATHLAENQEYCPGGRWFGRSRREALCTWSDG